MRRVGATWWASEQELVDVELGVRERTEKEKRVLVFGWPSDGVGVWLLRYGSEREMPLEFGRVLMAVNKDERVQIMKEYGAVFYDDVGELKEQLIDKYIPAPSSSYVPACLTDKKKVVMLLFLYGPKRID